MAYDIFISYRREGGHETAKHLFDLLRIDGYSVSFDIDTLRNGLWTEELEDRIEECKDFIIILSKGVFDRTLDPSVPFKDDWLRRELALAIKLEKNIIPVILSGFKFPNNLPDDVKLIADFNGPEYNNMYFDAFYGKLKSKFLKSEALVHSADKSVLKFRTDIKCRIFVDGQEKCSLDTGAMAKIKLSPGTYVLNFVDYDEQNNSYEIKVDVIANYDKLIEISLGEYYKPPVMPPSPVPPIPPVPDPARKKKTLTIVLVSIATFFVLSLGLLVYTIVKDSGHGVADDQYEVVSTDTVEVDTYHDDSAGIVDLYPFQDPKTGLYGYRNGAGEDVYAPQFDYAGPFDGDSIAYVGYKGELSAFTADGWIFPVEADCDTCAYD